eukprot:1858443-Pleurochrysis_carterae.AAC.6
MKGEAIICVCLFCVSCLSFIRYALASVAVQCCRSRAPPLLESYDVSLDVGPSLSFRRWTARLAFGWTVDCRQVAARSEGSSGHRQIDWRLPCIVSGLHLGAF